jgi:two-component system, LytTR family, response regulator LytT
MPSEVSLNSTGLILIIKPGTAMSSYFFIRVNRKNVRVELQSIKYIQAKGNFATMVTDSASHLVSLTIKELVKHLPPDLFCQVNRGCIVAINRIVAFDAEEVTLTGNKIVHFGSSYRQELERRVSILVNESTRKYSLQINETLN